MILEVEVGLVVEVSVPRREIINPLLFSFLQRPIFFDIK